MFYLSVFIVPLIFVIVLGLLEWLVVAQAWEQWLIDLGWDCHVLAWGALGAVFANPNSNQFFQPYGQINMVELLTVGGLLLLAVGILALRKNRPHLGWKSMVSFMIGCLSLALPAGIASHAHMK